MSPSVITMLPVPLKREHRLRTDNVLQIVETERRGLIKPLLLQRSYKF